MQDLEDWLDEQSGLCISDRSDICAQQWHMLVNHDLTPPRCLYQLIVLCEVEVNDFVPRYIALAWLSVVPVASPTRYTLI